MRGTGFGMAAGCWYSEADIAAWKAHAEHQLAQAEGLRRWYRHFELRIARVERAHGMGEAP